jgi:MFS family permease
LRALRSFVIEQLWHRLVLPLGEPEFYTEQEAELAQRLQVADKEVSAMLLAEAQEIDRSQHSSAESIQSRAMTLQGAVAIATTLTLTAGGLLLDRTKIESHGWRVAFAIVLLLAVLAFIASGVRALGASSRTFPWAQPGFNDIFDHAKLDLTTAQGVHAAAYLKAASQNLRIVQVKGGYLNAAVSWFRLALTLLAVLAAMFVAYTAWGQPSPAHPVTPAPKGSAH